MFSETFKNVKGKSPIIHCITNYVAANDCANILLACGASPIMADDVGEVEEITAFCSGLNISLGTFSSQKLSSMLAAGKKANELYHPVVFDAVGVGASKLRANAAEKLIEKIDFSVIKGNLSEIKALFCGNGTISGVDADVNDAEGIDEIVCLAKRCSKKTGAVIAVTGKTDVIADAEKAFLIYNGNQIMSRVTGTGCQLSALIAAFVSVNTDCVLKSAAAAVCAMGLCGEKAFERMREYDGNASCRNYLIDAVYRLNPEELERGANYEIR